jgi:C1A family cysteine protease
MKLHPSAHQIETVASKSTEEHMPTASDVNWIDEGCVGPVLNGDSCSASWAFAATGAIEGSHCVANSNKFESLSVQ